RTTPKTPAPTHVRQAPRSATHRREKRPPMKCEARYTCRARYTRRRLLGTKATKNTKVTKKTQKLLGCVLSSYPLMFLVSLVPPAVGLVSAFSEHPSINHPIDPSDSGCDTRAD